MLKSLVQRVFSKRSTTKSSRNGAKCMVRGVRCRVLGIEPLEDRALLTIISPDLLADGEVAIGIADSRPPASTGLLFAMETSSAPESAVILSEVPSSYWTYGCGPTAVGMLFGYYDRTGYDNMYTGPTNGGVAPLTDLGQGSDPADPIPGSCSIIATQNGFDGRSTPGHVDDYWIASGATGPDPWETGGVEHAWEGCTADFLGTNQWKWDTDRDGTINATTDGSTRFYYHTNGSKMYDPMPTGDAADGEVEDHRVLVTPFGPPAPLNTNAGSDAGGDYWPQIAADGNGNWVAVWYSGDSLGGAIGNDLDILVSRSTDAGATWTDPAPLNGNAGTDTGGDQNPFIATDGQGNWITVWRTNDSLGGTIGTDMDLLMSHSSDAGATWSFPIPLNSNAAWDSEFDDSPHISTDGEGTWVVTWSTKDDSLGGDADIFVARSTNAGASWTTIAPLNTNAGTDSDHDFSPQVTPDGDGNWIAVWYSWEDLNGTIGPDMDILVSRSNDAGATWTAPVPLNNNAALDSGGDLAAVLTTDGAGVWIALWYSNDSLGDTIGDDDDILISRSLDAGVTWTDPVPLNTNAASDSGSDKFAQLSTDGAGTWIAVWESTDSLGGVIGDDGDILVAWSFDDGVSWTAPTPLNGNAASDSGSDYRPQIATDGAGNWIALWDSYDTLGGTIGSEKDILFATLFEPIVNAVPVAVDDLYHVDEGTTLTITVVDGVLANDMDGDGDPLTAVLDVGPANGTLTLNADGSFAYTPDAGFRGFDSFTYFANDGVSDSYVSAQVTLRVEPPRLLADLNVLSWDPGRDFVEIGDKIVFVASDIGHGEELSVTDGTPEGTMLLMDIAPGIYNSSIGFLTAVDETAYFRASDGTHGLELWKTDGTPAGTTMVADIQPGSSDSGPYGLVVVGNTLYFRADDGTHGRELWKSDGTEAGTMMVKDILPGSGNSYPESFTAVGSTLFFSAANGTNGRELWSTDGTEAGTSMVADIKSGSGSSSPLSLVTVDSTLFFLADDGVVGQELWKSDGTATGTVLVKDIYPGYNSSVSTYLTVVGGTLFFRAKEGIHGFELWKSDGTEAGTVMVTDILPGSEGAFPWDLTAVGTTLFFTADDGITGTELWSSDGTAVGTTLLKDIRPGSNGSYIDQMTAGGSVLYFTANDGASGEELWKSDGTTAGTILLKDILPGSESSMPYSLDMAGDALYFSATSADGDGVWKSDGTAAGTTLVRQIAAPTQYSDPEQFLTIGNITYFVAYSPSYGRELWKTDKISGTTILVKDIFPGFIASWPDELTAVGDTLYFTASAPDYGTDVWKSDGTEAGTTIVKDLFPGYDDSWAEQLTAVGDTLFFRAWDSDTDAELWKTDGTEVGTVVVKEIVPDIYGSWPWELTAVGDTLFFMAYDEFHGDELWKSDGTEAGTVMVKDIWPGSDGSEPENLTAIGDTLYFLADDGSTGMELWKSDGTEVGTQLVKDILPGSESSSPWYLTQLGDVTYFSASDGTHGDELWRTDGTEAGTYMVRDICPGSDGSWPDSLTVAGDTLYFWASDGVTGEELWKSDGTEAGTQLVKDIEPGATGSWPYELVGAGDRLFFTAETSVTGYELWLSDGSEAGTVLYADLWPGSDYSNPLNLYYDGERLFFSAMDPLVGIEPWVIHLNDAPTSLTLDKATIPENQPAGTLVGMFSTTDPNAGDTHKYSFVSGAGDTDNGLFAIDGDQLKTAAVFDYETQGTYSVRVEVLDSGGGRYEKSFVISITDVDEFDFGDAPDPTYPTLLANDGARHVATGPTLGANRDTEADGQPTALADGDDTSGTPNDEDGIVGNSAFAPGMIGAWVDVVASGPSFVNAWLDFNANGIWEASEQLAVDLPLVTGTNHVTFDIPMTATPGPTYARLRLTSYNTGGTLMPTGPADDGEVEDYVLLIEGLVNVEGTIGDDTIAVQPGIAGTSLHRVTINGSLTTYDPAVFTTININALGGDDTISVIATTGSETAALNANSVNILGPAYELNATSVETIYVYGSAGDTTTLTGAAVGNNTFKGRPTYSELQGPACYHYVSGFDRVAATPGGGTNNRALLYGSAGADVLTASASTATIDWGGVPSATATGFNEVLAFGGAGDSASLTGNGAGGNTLYGRPACTELKSPTFYLYAGGFDTVTATPGGGTNNRALLYGGTGADTLNATPTSAVMDLAGAPSITATGFNMALGFGGSGDTANLTGDSAGDNFLQSRLAYTNMSGAPYYFFASGFQTVTATSGGATNNRAFFYNDPATSSLTADPTTATMDWNGTASATVSNFDRVFGFGSAGDTATFTGDSSGSNTFEGRPDYNALTGVGYYHYANGFDSVSATAGGGTNNRVFVYGGTGDDTLAAGPATGTMTWKSGRVAQMAGFDKVFGYGSIGDTANLTGDATAMNTFDGYSTYSTLYSAAFYHYVSGFDIVTATAGSATNDRANIYDSVLDDLFTSSPGSGQMDYGDDASTDISVLAFERIHTRFLNGGDDDADLTDSSAVDQFTGTGTNGQLTDAAAYWLYLYFDSLGTDTVTLNSSDTGNTVDANSLDYVLNYDPTYWVEN